MTSTRASGDTSGLDARLGQHLRAWLGTWPPQRPVHVVGWPGRLEPAWDGGVTPAVAVSSPLGTVVSVPPPAVEAAEALATAAEVDEQRRLLAEAVGRPGRASPWVTMRWSTAPAPLPDAGEWVEPDHPALPGWLTVFPGRVLAALDADGRYLAGAGLKTHSPWGQEVAVGTAEHARGRGLARRLAAQAGRAVIEGGAVPLYVHDPANAASARVADAAGYPDRGWRLMVVFASGAP